ncbi:beta-xylosidase [Echinicola sp. 20G]|uniref:GH39 family glycosyl hydrolase n=1 Tax=Echinicola sp. 20G TaxID=2781961 RepID=UPI0019111604|nr:beta-xylosidase [Echinicola sp. 20G]
MKRLFLFLFFVVTSLPFLNTFSTYGQSDLPFTPADTVVIQVNFDKTVGEMDPVWAWWGYDEPNYTYMKDGQKLLTEISQLSPVPVNVRAHSLLVTDEGTRAALKWGSTNAYTEDEQGNPVYDWTIVDKIFDTYVERGMKPFAQIGFMPKALSSKPEPYRHHWKPGAKYEEIYRGWAYPPKDYEKWAELVFQWVRHSVERYGKEEVESWYWELWNEPNIGYWQGTTEEYIKLYDYTADAVKRALPTAKIGGPETTGPGHPDAAKVLKQFLDHVTQGTNYVTGKQGSPLDFITFHAKGSPRLEDGVVVMDMGRQLRDIDKGFEIVASYPSLKNLPIIIGESDPEGCAACSEADYPHNAYRNGTMYSSYTAASFARKYQLADHYGVNFLGAVTWGFEFEDQAWFAGFRDMATNGVDKPVLNVFRMFGMMDGKRVQVLNGAGNSDQLAYDAMSIRDHSVRGNLPDINALAAKSEDQVTIMVWNYHDRNETAPASPISLDLKGLEPGKYLLEHFRVDKENSNAYELWKAMGSPQSPSSEQIRQLEKAGQLDLLTSPQWIYAKEGSFQLDMVLPRQGVSLLKLIRKP